MQGSGFLEPQDFLPLESRVFDYESQQLGGKRLHVRGIQIKAGRAYFQVLGIWRFENEQASRNEDAQGLGHDRLQIFETNVFDYMERRDENQTVGRCLPEGRKTFRAGNIKASFPAGFKHAFVQIDASPLQAKFGKQLKPFAPAAPDVQRGSGRLQI